MNSRDKLIKFIPKPENRDVIVYDISLSDLIDVNVFEEYYKLYPEFLKEREEYLELKNIINEYEKTINNIYLFNTSWDESDYLKVLQNDKTTYSKMYQKIKKSEQNIEILMKKAKNINEKIEIQLAKEKHQKEEKALNIDSSIKNNKEKLKTLKEKLEEEQNKLNTIIEDIKENEEDFGIIALLEEQLNSNELICPFCGHKTKSTGENSLIYKKVYKKIEKNKMQLEKLLSKKDCSEKNISFYNDEISKVKIQLDNDIQFKKQDYTFYQKKSIEVLKLEALRDEIVNNIYNLKKELKSNPELKSEQYIKLKERINNYELSLNNLTKIKTMRLDLKSKISDFNDLKDKLIESKKKIDLYIKFIEIYYKIYEKKANEYFGNDFKFKIFKFDDYKLEEIFELRYKTIEYSQLTQKDKNFVDKTFAEKIAIFD